MATEPDPLPEYSPDPTDPPDPPAPPDTTYVLRDRHLPTLVSGRHELTATLTVTVDTEAEVCATRAEFFVGGERFSLAPADVHSVYPPEGSRGDHGHSLPHIALRRDTLPWERKADGTSTPWLALILLNAEEAARHRLETVTLDECRRRIGGMLVLEPGQAGTDQVQLLEIDSSLIPTRGELASLCHVRGELASGGLTECVAVVVSRRLPHEGRNTVHLVSLEDRYQGDTLVGGAQFCTVVSLKSWSFTCEKDKRDESESLAHLFQKLDGSWLRIPPDEKTAPAEPYISRGRVPLPHRFRTGESGVSFYAGPLFPGPPSPEDPVNLPAGSADELLVYHERLGMLDITYAAAWELGRLLALEHREVEIALSAWRRQKILAGRWKEEQRTQEYARLPQLQRALAQEAAPAPKVLVDWMKGLWRLEGIPFKYLVPDERMLTPESIRFFSVNRRWMDALLDGVLSLTRPATRAERGARSAAEQELLGKAVSPQVLTGFLLRSAVVSGWPGLEVEATGGTVHHSVDLSPSIRMVLFSGQPTRVAIHQHAGTLHLAVKDPIWKDQARRVLEIDTKLGSAALAKSMLARAESLELGIPWA
jgi:hypothetical protein